MRKKSVITESQEIQLAVELVNLGARLQLLESETSLSRERLLKIYKELKGASPPKGMLPFSTDWFLTWKPNINSSLFMNIHNYLTQHAEVKGIDATVRAYKLYLEQMENPKEQEPPVLSLTRAWTLVRFFESNMLGMTTCSKCGGNFVAYKYDLHGDYTCGLCHIPSRAGKLKKVKDIEVPVAD